MLSTLAGAVVARGLMTQDQQTAIVGGLMTLVAVVWSIIQKKKVADAVDAMRTSMQPSATVTNIAAAQSAKGSDTQGIY
jgi:hypothetical protein